MQASRGKLDRLHCTPAGFTVVTLGGYGLRYQLLARPITPASYPVSVRQVAALFHASFRPHLAMSPLRFTSTSPPPGCAGDFHPQAVKHARHTTKKPPSGRLQVTQYDRLFNLTAVSSQAGTIPHGETQTKHMTINFAGGNPNYHLTISSRKRLDDILPQSCQ
jgi:hypothetical protein